jgi:uncharacterized protein YdhG (YjbR/CyaY superfamily)
MKAGRAPPKDVDAYIADFPAPVQRRLKAIRAAIRAAAPLAQEKISYRMPAFELHGRLVYFAAFKNHIGFYPLASGIARVKSRLAGYVHAAGSVQFPLDKPLPLGLIGTILRFRVKENMARQAARPKRK